MDYEKRYNLIRSAKYELHKLENETTATLQDSTWERIAQEQKEFREIFERLAFPPGYMTAIENRYWPDAYEDSQRPWYEYHCALGVVRVGWRKRVISIHWPNDKDRRRIVTGDDTTHYYDNDGGCIHAYGLKKCEEYLGLILEALKRVLPMTDGHGYDSGYGYGDTDQYIDTLAQIGEDNQRFR